MRQLLSATLMAALTFMPLMDAPAAVAANQKASRPATSPPTTTPIKHLVVIFQENVSFDQDIQTEGIACPLSICRIQVWVGG